MYIHILKKNNSIYIPTLIVEILRYRYKVKEFRSHKARIPKNFFNLPSKIIALGIRAFADDEAAVGDTSIRFYSSNIKLLNQLCELIKNKFPIPSIAIKKYQKFLYHKRL